MRVLFIDNTHPILPELLTKNGFQVDYLTDLPKEQYYKLIPDYEGIIIRSKISIDKKVLDSARKLRFIGRVGAGMDSIDVNYAAAKGVLCLNSPEGNRDAVGEHTLGMLLNLMNNINTADRQVRQGKWMREANRGEEIKGKTIGIIGYGNMGSAFAERLQGFGASIIAYDKYKTGFSTQIVKEVQMLEIFETSDILSLHVPLTKETTYMFDDKYINNFHKQFRLLNTSRGMLVNTEDLVKALVNGKVKGAALDVIEYEDTSFEFFSPEKQTEAMKYLIASEKVLLTPHIAGWSQESQVKLASILADKILSEFTGLNNI